MDLLTTFLARNGYLPHGYCFTWTPGLLWTMVGSDAFISLAYFSIPLAIVSFARRRAEPFIKPVAWLFCAFIFACGLTHVLDIWTVWQPDYGLQALTKAATAVISIVTAIALWPLIPRALEIPSTAQLRSVIASLESEVRQRRSAEDRLAEIQQNLAVTLASIDAGFMTTDPAGRVVRMNVVAERLTGWTQARAAGQNLWEVLRWEDRPLAYAAMNPVDVMIQQGVNVDTAHHVIVIARDGTRTRLEVKAALTRADDGSVRGLAMVFRDMTRLLRAEAESQRLAAIVRSSNDAIIGKSLEGVITSWNPGAQRLFGYAPEEAIGRPMSMLIPPDRPNEEPEILRRIALGETVEHFETPRKRKDGTLVYISASISPVRDAAGRVIGASSISRDITERRQAEARQRAQLQRLNLLDQITCAIGERQDLRSIYQVAVRSLEDELPADFSCVLAREGDAESLRVAGVGLLGDSLSRRLDLALDAPVAIDGNGLSRCLAGDLVHEPDTSALDFPFPRRLAGAGLLSLVVAPLRSESRVFGALVAARRAAHAFSSGECEFIRQLSTHVGLAAHQAQLNESLQQALHELRLTQQAAVQQERLRALGQMASGIAHDINNAISPAVLYAESLLEREPLSERARAQVQSIAQAVDDVAATVARMREFYRPREPQVALLPVELNKVVTQVVDLSRARWHDMPLQRGVVIETDLRLAGDLPPVWGAESEIREALINLVFNAVDAMPQGGTLGLRTRWLAAGEDGAPVVAVEVSDTGMGMDEETRRRCLEPFFTTKGERGTGMGLAMVYGTAQRHGARITIQSAPGDGSTIGIEFPSRAATAVADAVESVRGVAERLRILLVDDDPVLLRSLRDTLEADGHATVSAGGGQEGIDLFGAGFAAGEPFDVVITDLGMPRVDGRAVALAIKQRSAATPVILLTGWGQRMAEDGDTPDGVDVVLGKPPRLGDLRDGLARCRAPRGSAS